MRFFKFAVLFLGVAFFIAPQFVLAGTCTEPDACNVGDLCNWPGSTQGTYCGKPSFYNRCKVNSSGKPICTALLNIVCDSTKSSVSQCGTVLVCISNKCVAPVTCEMKSLTDMQGTCESGQVCVISKCVDAKSPEAAETVKQYADLKKSSDAADARTAATRATLGLTASSTSSTYGSGNVTCGNRTFTCTRGGWFSGVSDQCYCCGSCTPDDLLTVGNTVLKWLFSIIGAVGLAMFVWGGFKFITSAGSGSDVTAGKKAMTNAVIGLVIMFSAGAVVMWIQDKLGINQEVRVNITNDGPAYVAPTSSSSSGKTEVHGTTKIGESCLYQQSTSSSQCGEGLYCYSIDQTKGVCLPQNPEKSVEQGGVCYVLPGDGSKDMCKTGTCQAADKTVGTKGTCPTVEDNPSMNIGNTCKTDAECAGKNLFTVSSTCYKKSGSSTGKCIPASGRGNLLSAGDSCYVLPGTANDCPTGLLCVQNPDASDPKLNRTIGELGVCYNYKNQTRGYACSKSFECSSADSCLSVPKASNRSYCLKTGTTFNDTENQACELIELSDGTTDVDSCVSGLTCMEVDGSMKCSR